MSYVSGGTDDELWDTHDVAEYLGVSRQRVHQLLRTPARAFPQPVFDRAGGFFWRGVDIERWKAKRNIA